MNEEKLKIVLVDDHQLFREGLKRIINLESDMAVVAEFSEGQGVFERYADINPAVILMDINMPNMNGVDATKKIKELYPEAKIMILSFHDDESYVFETLKVGAAGYLLKDMDSETLIDAIRAVASGSSFIHPSIAGKVIADYRRLSKTIEMYEEGYNKNFLYIEKVVDWRSILTTREIEVLQNMAKGNNNRVIEKNLFISEKTVKNHVSNILQKLNVQDRTQAVITAIKYGWVDLN